MSLTVPPGLWLAPSIDDWFASLALRAHPKVELSLAVIGFDPPELGYHCRHWPRTGLLRRRP